MTTKTTDAPGWTTKVSPPPEARETDIEWTTTHRGLKVVAGRSRFGVLSTRVRGNVGERRVVVFGPSPWGVSDDELRAEALALADALAELGLTPMVPA